MIGEIVEWVASLNETTWNMPGKEMVADLTEFLNDHGISAESFSALNKT